MTFNPRVKKIESSTNSLYKKLMELTTSRGIKEHQLTLVSGEKIISEFLQRTKKTTGCFWVSESEIHPLLTASSDLQIVLLSKELFKALDTVGTHSPLLCIPTPELAIWNEAQEPSGLEVLCALGDPNNLGALLRSAFAFGAQSIVLLQECCNPFLPKVIKSSAGACLQLNLLKGPALKDLISPSIPMHALDMQGTPLSQIQFPQNFRILLGEEGQGVPATLAAKKISIPMNPKLESLNATVAASLLFYSYAQQHPQSL